MKHDLAKIFQVIVSDTEYYKKAQYLEYFAII